MKRQHPLAYIGTFFFSKNGIYKTKYIKYTPYVGEATEHWLQRDEIRAEQMESVPLLSVFDKYSSTSIAIEENDFFFIRGNTLILLSHYPSFDENNNYHRKHGYRVIIKYDYTDVELLQHQKRGFLERISMPLFTEDYDDDSHEDTVKERIAGSLEEIIRNAVENNFNTKFLNFSIPEFDKLEVSLFFDQYRENPQDELPIENYEYDGKVFHSIPEIASRLTYRQLEKEGYFERQKEDERKEALNDFVWDAIDDSWYD